MSSSDRPYVICHMIPSLDGRIVMKDWDIGDAEGEYEKTSESFRADAWIAGRVSMEEYAGKGGVPKRKSRERIPRSDFVADHDSDSYAITIDPSGKLKWKSGDVDGEHVITILAESVSDDYLAFLQSKGVSYLFGGKSRIDVPKVLRKLRKHFGIERLLLEGGGSINGTFFAADAIDELSILVAPVADASPDGKTIFDVDKRGVKPRGLDLISVKKRKGGIVWLRYKVRR